MSFTDGNASDIKSAPSRSRAVVSTSLACIGVVLAIAAYFGLAYFAKGLDPAQARVAMRAVPAAILGLGGFGAVAARRRL